MLIGNHVITAPTLKESDIEVLSTGYILIDSGKATSVSYMSNTTPIPHDKDDIAVCTAIAGEMLGLKIIYMDAGSGAKNSVSEKMIASVAKNIDIQENIELSFKCELEKKIITLPSSPNLVL